MKKHLSKKRVVLAAIIAVALAIASGVAYAYWTGAGVGSGAAAASSSTTNLTINQNNTLTDMYPGDSTQDLAGNFSNTNAATIHVSSVTVSISSVDKAIGAPAGTCDASDFVIANATATVNQDIPTGTSGSWSGPTIQFNNKTTNQDACKGATVNLDYTTS